MSWVVEKQNLLYYDHVQDSQIHLDVSTSISIDIYKPTNHIDFIPVTLLALASTY